MPLPLEGYRILELGMWGAIPHGGCHLADMGAEVIKIEEPVGGDRTRGMFNSTALDFYFPHQINYVFERMNRGKKSVGVDVRKEEGKQAVYRLLTNCDAFVTGLRRKTLKKVGLDYDSVSKVNPRIIYVHLSAFGAKGPDADLPGQDLTGQARGGLLERMRPRPEDGPLAEGIQSVADLTSSLQLAYATTLALLTRERTGVGQEVNVSILGGQIAVGDILFQIYLTTGGEPYFRERTRVGNPIRNIYRCADGKWLALGMSEGDRYWPYFCQAIARPDLAKDARFDHINKRVENRIQLIAILDEVFSTKSRDEWCFILKESDCTAAPVQTYAELAQDPQVLANNYITTVDHPTYGPMQQVGLTVDLSKTPGRVRSSAPEMGQHTEEILMELGGYTWEEISALKDSGATI